MWARCQDCEKSAEISVGNNSSHEVGQKNQKGLVIGKLRIGENGFGSYLYVCCHCTTVASNLPKDTHHISLTLTCAFCFLHILKCLKSECAL